jgi:hypothetical protein
MPYLTDSQPIGRDTILNRKEVNMALTLAECHAPDRTRMPEKSNGAYIHYLYQLLPE